MNSLRTEYRIIQVLLMTVGIAAVIIGAMIFFLGILPTVHFFESGFSTIAGSAVPLDPPTISATLDNEFRFYATLWISYGVVALWIARHIREQLKLVPVFFGVFFLGGIGRVMSLVSLGPPHPVFIALMIVEFVIPVLALLAYVSVSRVKREPGEV